MFTLYFVLCCAMQGLPSTGNTRKEEIQARSALRGLHKLLPLFLSKESSKFGGVLSTLPGEVLSLVGGSEKQQQNCTQLESLQQAVLKEAALSFPISSREHPRLPPMAGVSIIHPSFPLLSAGESLLVP